MRRLVIWIVLHQAVRTLCDAEPSMCLYMLESSARLALRIVACKAPNLNFAFKVVTTLTMGANAGRRSLLSKESFDHT